MDRDKYYLETALAHAERGVGICAPNPSVGAVLVQKDFIISMGYHHGQGLPHAEVEALFGVGEGAKGATLYVTLEPCCHWGLTPPCTELLIKAGVNRVVYAVKDPNPKVSGKGEAELRQAGITCERIQLPQAEKFYRAYRRWTETGLPFVTAKLALSLDGKIAGPAGEPVGITGEELSKLTHLERRRTDAILTSERTITRDNPRLNARIAADSVKKPIYIVDCAARMTPQAQIFETAKQITIFHGDAPSERLEALRRRGAELVPTNETNGRLSLDEVLQRVGKDGRHTLWVEAGSELFGSLWKEGRLNRALLYVGMKWLGMNAQTAFEQGIDLSGVDVRWEACGRDAYCEMEL